MGKLLLRGTAGEVLPPQLLHLPLLSSTQCSGTELGQLRLCQAPGTHWSLGRTVVPVGNMGWSSREDRARQG